MRVAITGATGLVGGFFVEEALAAGDEVLVLGRRPPATGTFSGPVDFRPFDLNDVAPPPLGDVDALVHAALDHVAGRYRGGEGADAASFVRRNRDASVRLFEAAAADGVGRLVFLSSRAVYGDGGSPRRLDEGVAPCPDTLYGCVKREVEVALETLAARGAVTASLRATGVYGRWAPGRPHKWQALFAAFLADEPIAPRVATEVYGGDVASAVRRLLLAPPDAAAGRAFNCSDLILDRRALLGRVADLAGVRRPLPPASDRSRLSVMPTARLERLGWRPGGQGRLDAVLPDLVAG